MRRSCVAHSHNVHYVFIVLFVCYVLSFKGQTEKVISPMPHPNFDEDLQRDLKDLAELQELSRRLDDHEYRLDALDSSLDATKRLLALERKWPGTRGGTGSGSPI